MKIEKKPLGETGLYLPVLGLGTASIGGVTTPVPDEDARATIAAALDAGITHIDTAPQYGYGKAERMVGDAVRGRTDIVISSKCGRLLVPHPDPHPETNAWKKALPFIDSYDYTYSGIIRSYEDSLQRLGLASFDIIFVHDIGAETHGAKGKEKNWDQLTDGGGYQALLDLRASGRIKAIGLGVNEWEILMDALALGDWDVFLLAGRYTLLEQTSLSPLLEACVEREVAVICGGPFNSGVLAGGETWNYARAPEDIFVKIGKIKSICSRHGVEVPTAALQFPMAHPAIVSTIPGPRTPAEFHQILEWWQTDIPPALWTDMADAGLFEKGTPLPGGGVV